MLRGFWNAARRGAVTLGQSLRVTPLDPNAPAPIQAGKNPGEVTETCLITNKVFQILGCPFGTAAFQESLFLRNGCVLPPVLYT